MFKNPIKKYQSGGVTPEQARQQVVQFIIQKTGATEDQVNGFLDKISGDEKALGEFQQILELASKDDPKGIDMLKQLFGTQSSQFVKKGGKLHNFICKHAKGGVAGCGCKEDGGKVEKAQLGTTAPTYLYNENGYPVEMNERTSRDGRVLIQETPTSVGEAMHLFNSLSANAGGYAFPIEYNMQRLHMLGDGAMSVQPISGFERDLEAQKINRWKTPNTKPNPDAKENGGIIKGEKGLSLKDALSAAKNNYGFNDSQARLAYANAKNALRNSGLRGRELEQAAREMIAKRPTGKEGIQAIPSTEPIALQSSKETIKAAPTTSAPKQFDLSNMPYNQAFGLATKLANSGLGTSTFKYKDMVSGTKLGKAEKQDENKKGTTKEEKINVKLPVIDTNFEIETPEIEIPQFEQLPTDHNIQYTASRRYPITVQQYTLDPSFWGSDLMSENSVNASAARNGLFAARVKANPVDIDNPKAVRLATYTKIPVDSGIQGAPVSLHYVSAEPRAIPSTVYSPVYKPSGIVTRENGGVVKAQGGIARFLQNLGNNLKNKSRARLYDHDLNKDVVVDLPEDLVSTAYGWPGHDAVYNKYGQIITAGSLSDLLGRKGSDYTRTDYYDPSLDSLNPYLYKREIRTLGTASDGDLYYGDPIKRDTIITKSLLGIGPSRPVEPGSNEYNSVNTKLDSKDSSKVYHRKLGKSYKKNK